MKRYTRKPGEVVVVDTIPPCFFCAAKGIDKPGPYDFATKMGPWANGCESHWLQYRASIRLGVGQGQLWITKDQLKEENA